jgi:hypothetical protein
MKYFAPFAGECLVARWKLGLVAIAAALVISSAASAGTMNLYATVQATYTTAGSLIAETFIADGQPHIYRVGIFVQVSNLAAGESFGLVGYDISLTGGLSRNTLNIGGATTGLTNPKPNYVPDNPTTNLIISASGNPLSNWYTGGQNGDLGTAGDLIGMLTAIDPANLNGLEDNQAQPATDPRLAIGTSALGTRIGVVYVLWNGTTPGQFNFNNGLGAFADVPGKKFFNSFPVSGIFTIPEPGTIVLMGMAGVGLAFMARRRRSA